MKLGKTLDFHLSLFIEFQIVDTPKPLQIRISTGFAGDGLQINRTLVMFYIAFNKSGG